VSAYAFLSANAVSVFSGKRLPVPSGGEPAPWIEDQAGLHVCRAADLPHWLDEELWEVELAQAAAVEGLLVDRRARLLLRVESWTPALAQEFTEACAWRSRDQAVRVLLRHGADAPADALAATVELDDVERWGAMTALDQLPDQAALAADAAALTRGRRPESWRSPSPSRRTAQPAAVTAANLGFVVAHGAGVEAADEHGSDAYASGVRDERAWQAAWLVRRLELS
jgi:hypothetical protein